MRKQELMFAILKLAAQDIEIIGEGVVGVADGFGFLRSANANYHRRGRTTSTSRPRAPPLSLKTGDTVESPIRSREGRALLRAAQGQYHQFRRPGEDPAQDPFRQPHPAYPTSGGGWKQAGRQDLSARVIAGGALGDSAG